VGLRWLENDHAVRDRPRRDSLECERGLELRAIPKTRPVLAIVRKDGEDRIVRCKYLYEESRMEDAFACLRDRGIPVQDVR